MASQTFAVVPTEYQMHQKGIKILSSGKSLLIMAYVNEKQYIKT